MKPKKIVDLSFVIYNCMPAFPTAPSFLYERTKNVARDGVTAHMIHQMTPHTGTHIDLPLEHIVGGASVDQLSVEAFMGEGVVVDLSHKKPKERITVEDLKKYDDEIKSGDVLMLHTGWDKKFGFNPEYLFEWPHVVEETAKYLVEKGVKALGIDALSIGGWGGTVPGHGPTAREDSNTETHNILLGAGIILVEVLKNLDQVLSGAPARRAYFIYAPIAIQGAEGGQCRALALLF